MKFYSLIQLNFDISQVEQVIAPIVGEEGFKIYDIVWAVNQGRRVLRVLIEGETRPVTLGDCARVSHAIEDILEVKQIILSSYDLEVSSPGLDRPLKKKEHFERVVGNMIRLKTRIPLEGRQNYKGVLKSVQGGILVMEIDGKDYPIPFCEVAKANLEYTA